MRTKPIDHLPWVLVILGPLLLIGPMLIRGEALFWGTPLLQFVPWRQFALQTLQKGHLPLWNPMLGMGAPLMANYQTAFLYPPNFLLPLIGTEWGHGLLVALHLIWAGLGMVFLARRLKLGSLAQSMAGLSFGLSGYLVARGGFLSINASAAWLPWIVLAVDRVAERANVQGMDGKTLKVGLVLSLTMAFQWLAGHAQTAWYTLVLILLWGSWRAMQIDSWKGLQRTVFRMLGSGIFAFSLSAIQLLPTAEYLSQSHRVASLDPEFAFTYSFWPWRLLGLLMPGLFGSPAVGDYWGYGNYWEDAIYIGVLPFLLAIWAGIRGLRRRDELSGLSRFLVFLSVGALILALGRNTPVFPFLFNNLPSFNLFQAPTRWNLILVFSMAFLAAIGAEAWRVPTGRALYWTRLGTVGAAMVCISTWLGSPLIAGIEPSFTRAFTLVGFLLFTSGVLSLLGSRRFSSSWISVTGLVVLVDLVVVGFGLNPSTDVEIFSGESLLTGMLGTEHRLYMPSDVEYELKFNRTHRFDTFNEDLDWRVIRDLGLPNTTLLDPLPSANNFDPILPDRYVVWMNAVETLPLSQRLSLLALMNVGWQASLDETTDTGIRYDKVPGAKRIRLVPNIILVDSPEAALSQVLTPKFDPSNTIVLEETINTALPIGAAEGVAELMESEDPCTELITVDTPNGSWLLLSDVWYPGWQAWIDDVETTMHQADYLFRAVWVPPGEHTVVFHFRPTLMAIALGLSVAAWLLMLWMGWRCRRD
jgi:uncharacterized membrane protein YfhO